MLDLSRVDLGTLAAALDDHSDDQSWWIDADTGEIWSWLSDSGLSDPEEDPRWDPDNRADARRIDPLPSRVGYHDMEEFIELIAPRRPADLLSRAIAGRGAFRRFKDTLFEFPELREQWFRFSNTRMQRRAIEFLTEEDLLDQAIAQRALAQLDDPVLAGGNAGASPRAVAAAVAAELRRLYGDRLVVVVLYGSHSRGDAHEDSNIDLAVVLDQVISPWEELRRMDDILWRHTLDSGHTISATPLSRLAWSRAERPLVRTAKADGIQIG